MRVLAYLYADARASFMWAVITGTLSGVCAAGLAWVVGNEVNRASVGATSAWWFVSLGLATLLMRTVSAFALMNLVQAAVFRLRVGLSHQLLATPFQQLQNMGAPKLLAILTGDVTQLVGAFQLVPITFGNAVVVFTCLTYLAWLSWPLFMMIALILLVGVLAFRKLEQKPAALMADARETTDTLFHNFRGLIEGSKELQLNAQRGAQFVDEVIATGARDNQTLHLAALRGYTWADNLGTLMFYVCFGLLLFVAPHWAELEREVVVKFTVTLLFLVGPIAQVISSLPTLRSAEVSFQKIQQLQASFGTQDLRPLPNDPFVSQQTLRLQLCGVCHQHIHVDDDQKFTLGPLDLSIHAGELLFIVGGNGSGKTTLAMLLLGFYAPEGGELRLNGQAVTTANLAHYRRYFSAVFSDFHLFEQLLEGQGSEAYDEQATRYVQALGLEKKVRVVQGKFSTVQLSSGQRKRLALISAYLEDRPIILFDEWAADQDPVFKKFFYTELLPDLKRKGKTVIVITHDDAYFAQADRVIKLGEGVIQTAQSTPNRITERAIP
jgi:putative pyoverdin transport system ATP-binding/permease protein